MKGIRTWQALLLLALLGSTATLADPLLPPVRLRMDHIGVADGLPQGSVYFMLKDAGGFMWFGTQDGLCCYDGHRFQTYRPNATQPGRIRGVNIFGIVEDPLGFIWVGTEEGLNRYDRQTNTFTCFYAEKTHPGQLPLPCRTLPFAADTAQLLYLSDREGLVSVNYRTLRKHVLDPTLTPRPGYDLQSSTVKTPAGDVWLHGTVGLTRYNLAQKKAYHYYSNHPENLIGSPKAVFCFQLDPHQPVVWIGTANGLIGLNYQTGHAGTYATVGTKPLSPVYSLAADDVGRLWVGTQQQGIFYFDTRSRFFGLMAKSGTPAVALERFEINKLFVDKQGIIWANADPNGLVKLVPNTFVMGGFTRNLQAAKLPASQQLTSFIIRGFAEFAVTPADRARPLPPLWVGTEDGINVLDQITGQVLRHYLVAASRGQSPTHTSIKRLYTDPYGRLWVGTMRGAYLFHPRDQTFELLPFRQGAGATAEDGENFARDFAVRSADTLLAATERGIFELSLARRRWQQRPELANQNLFCLWLDAATRQLWVGTYLNGFVCYQLPPPGSGRAWRRMGRGLSGSTVLQIHPDPVRHTVWLATDRGLVALNRRTGQLTPYTEQNGLANAFIYGVLPDHQNNLWMSTNRGITRLDPGNGKIKNFGLEDGLQGLEFNGNALLRTRNGTLLFGGVNGFNSCLPNQYQPLRTNPPVYLYNLLINEIPYGNDAALARPTLALNDDQRTFSLEFAAVDFLSNGQNQYAYKLSNYDADWVQAGKKNYVRYVNVPPGEYTLEVKAANKDGHWSNRIRRLAITIRPPLWQTVPFMLLVSGLLGGLMWLWVRHREALIRQQQTEQLRLSFEVQEQVKKDIARDLHDEIGTRLATLKLYTTQLARFAGDSERPRTLRSAINSLINDTISDVRDLLRELNPRTLSQYGFGPALEELLDRINATGAIEAHCTLDLSLGRLPLDTETMLYRIVQELLNNTLKHANATQIDITCRYREDRIHLTYADNGQGFSYERVRQGLGIGNIESRVALLQGSIQWQTGADAGTSVVLVVPLPNVDGQPRISPWRVKLPSA